MSLACPNCGHVVAGTGDLTPVCNGCGKPCVRKTSSLLPYKGAQVLICADCTERLAHQDLETILNPTEPIVPTTDGESDDPA